jgi:hypothetical protein
MLATEEVSKTSEEARKEKSAKLVWKSNFVTRSMTVTNDKIGSEKLIIETKNSKKVLKSNCVTRSMKVTDAEVGSRTHEDESDGRIFNARTEIEEALSEKSKKKKSSKSFEVRAILGEKIDFKLRASTATNDFIKSIPSFKVLKNDEVKNKVIKSFKIRANIATNKFVNSIPRFKALAKKNKSSSYSLRAKDAANNFFKFVPRLNSREVQENRVEEVNLNRSMFDLPHSVLLHGHDTSEKILKALLLFWENSGRGNYGNLSNALVNDLLNSEATSFSPKMNSLQNELKAEKLTINDQSNITKKFNQKLGNGKPLIACASCGERNYNNICKEVRIHEELEILKLSANQIEEL